MVKWHSDEAMSQLLHTIDSRLGFSLAIAFHSSQPHGRLEPLAIAWDAMRLANISNEPPQLVGPVSTAESWRTAKGTARRGKQIQPH